jgi:hypothetical protein
MLSKSQRITHLYVMTALLIMSIITIIFSQIDDLRVWGNLAVGCVTAIVYMMGIGYLVFNY